MDLNINVKIELQETPALLNCFSAFCTTVERCCALLEAQQLAISNATVVVTEEPKAEIPAPVTAEEPPAEATAVPAEPVNEEKPKEYTLEDFRRACAPLLSTDATVGAKIKEVIEQFGVNALPDIPKERYSELAEKLRAFGADL